MNYGIQAAGQNAQTIDGPYEAKMAFVNRTIGQNIDARIQNLRAEIERLEGVREQLTNGASLLDVRIEDLRQAMNY